MILLNLGVLNNFIRTKNTIQAAQLAQDKTTFCKNTNKNKYAKFKKNKLLDIFL